MSGAFDDSTTDSLPLRDVHKVVETPSVSNTTDGNKTDPASGLTRGDLVWERKKTVSQCINVSETGQAVYTIRSNVPLLGEYATAVWDLHDFVSDLVPHNIWYKYEHWSIENFTVQIQATANWLSKGGSAVVSYVHDPMREATAVSDPARQADMYMTRITDTQRINIPVRTDWFYLQKTLTSGKNQERFISPGGIKIYRRGLGLHDQQYQVVASIHATIRFATTSLVMPPTHGATASHLFPRFYSKVVGASTTITPTDSTGFTLIHFKLQGVLNGVGSTLVDIPADGCITFVEKPFQFKMTLTHVGAAHVLERTKSVTFMPATTTPGAYFELSYQVPNDFKLTAVTIVDHSQWALVSTN